MVDLTELLLQLDGLMVLNGGLRKGGMRAFFLGEGILIWVICSAQHSVGMAFAVSRLYSPLAFILSIIRFSRSSDLVAVRSNQRLIFGSLISR
jgi:hypothetical protein